jgi:hypothetical protein
MRSWLKSCSFILALLLVFALPSFAQINSATRGGIGGTVYDSSGAVMPGVAVTITGPQGVYTAKTDASGRYELDGQVPGSYKVVVELPGFKRFISEHNQVVVDHTANLDVHLALGAATDTVQVDAGAVQIDTETTSLNAPISDELYESLPVARNVAAIFQLAPGVVTGGGTGSSNPSIGGATGLENLYLVDGVTITDQAFGGLGTYNRFFGSLGSGVNLAFIKEVDVKTGAFEPKYGRADGGIVEIVTKSGTSNYHGALAAYLGPGSWYATRNQLSDYGYVNTIQARYLSNPQYDVAGEFGGYVPGMKNKMFFFGAYDPTLTQDIARAPDGAPLAPHGPYAYSTTINSWAAKITWQPFSIAQLEASTFADPSRHNQVPGPTWQAGLQAGNADSVGTSYNYGSRDSVARLSTSLTPTWTAMAVYTYNFNHFDQTPLIDSYNISNRTTTPFVLSYIGSYEPTKNNDWSINVETEKRAHFLGEHTFAVGYTYDHTNFLDSPTRTGALFAIPNVNAAGDTLDYGAHNSAVGQFTNATFRLFNANPSCTACTMYNGKPVYLQQIRGTYEGLKVQAGARYTVGWANDSYQMNRYVTFNAGLRWEQQWYNGDLLHYLFNDNWSPRVGVNVDPFGNQKTKIFFNYARYQLVLPLDAAIRQLGNEQDVNSLYFTPQKDNSTGEAALDDTGTVVVTPDSAHLLNGLIGKGTDSSGNPTFFGKPSFASSTGEGIIPGTRMEYENEFVLGFQREIVPGSVLAVRYSDRRLGRIVEDIGSQSPEGSLVDGNYAGGIANVLAGTDYFTNEQEVTYTADQWNAANGGKDLSNSDNYTAPAEGCTYANDTSVANGGLFSHYDGSPYGGACVTNAADAGAYGPDGKPDGFAQPERLYKEVVVEFNRNLKNNWQMRANYRWAKLWGNYEGLFRNDNGQSDPGISSLFDFTAGAIGLLGDQFKAGYLNTDRRNVANISVAYVVPKGGALSLLNKMNLGTNIRAAAGNPLSAYASHPIYLNQGEIPVGGRGTKGNLPSTFQVDGHMDYPWQFHEKYTMKFALDAFNLFNTQKMTSKNQFLDLSPGVQNVDYGRPGGAANPGFQGPFYARASIRLEF